MKNLKGKNALLTGGSRGLGRCIAKRMAQAGINLALTARSAEALEETAAECRRFNVMTKSYPGDITKAKDRETLIKNVKTDLGDIDILVNNAGMEWVSAYTALSSQDIEAILKTNLMAPMLLTRLVLPDMLARGTGHIVNMSSMGGKKGSPYSATYAATKAGLIQFTQGLRAELHGSGVGVSVICPGFVADVGMFAVYNKRAPKIVGETTPEKVADATLKAIQENIGELIVNPGPIKPMMMLDVINPDIGSWLLRTFGVYDFYRKQADDNQATRK